MGAVVFMPLTEVPALLDGSEYVSADLGQPRQIPATQSTAGSPLHKQLHKLTLSKAIKGVEQGLGLTG